PGPVDERIRLVSARSGVRALTVTVAPEVAGAVTRRWVWSPWTRVSICKAGSPGCGRLAGTMSPKKRFADGHWSRPAVQRPWASLVQAMTRPRPYCQVASSGSPWGLFRTISAAAFGVVATYPVSDGNASSETPGSTSRSVDARGVIVPSTIQGFRASLVSLRKIAGTSVTLLLR